MGISRREYLAILRNLALLPIIGGTAMADSKKSEKKETWILQGGFAKRPANYLPHGFYPSSVYGHRTAFRFELDSNRFTEIETETSIHSIENSPIDSNISVGFSRISDKASRFDWLKRRETAVVELPFNTWFYGHGAFSDDASKIFASVIKFEPTSGDRAYGFVTINAATFKVEETMIFPYGPCHDIVPLPNDEIAIAACQLATPTTPAGPLLVIYNWKKRTSRYMIGDFPPFESGEIGMRHLLKTGETTILGTATRTDGARQAQGAMLSFDTATGKSTTLSTLENAFFGELLSFDVGSDGRIWITMPDSKQMFILNPVSKKIDEKIKFSEAARSIRALNGRDQFIIGTDRRFLAYDSRSAYRLATMDQKWPEKSIEGRICSHTKLFAV